MERYWCLRWLEQEKRQRMMASVLKDGAVRFADIPLVARVPELMQAARGTQVMLEIASTDELSLEVSCRVQEVFAGDVDLTDEMLELDEEASEVSAEAAAEAAAEDAAEQRQSRWRSRLRNRRRMPTGLRPARRRARATPAPAAAPEAWQGPALPYNAGRIEADGA